MNKINGNMCILIFIETFTSHLEVDIHIYGHTHKTKDYIM